MAWFRDKEPPRPNVPGGRHPRSQPPDCSSCDGKGWTESEGACIDCGTSGIGSNSQDEDD